MLHNVPPPLTTLARLLAVTPAQAGNYGHLLLEQQVGAIDDIDITEFRPYFESAHLDAREAFHRSARISLHPEAGATGAHATYPNCLPAKTARGLFGEVMTGMIAQAYAPNIWHIATPHEQVLNVGFRQELALNLRLRNDR